MKRKEISLFLLLFLLISFVFFYKTILKGLVPIPGDLLISEYTPWKTYAYMGFSPGSFPTKEQYFDVIRQMYPWKSLVVNVLKNGQIPLWNPYNFSGAPLLANFQSSVFYPLNGLYFLFPQITAWSMLVFLQTLLSSFFTYVFIRKLHLSKLSATFAAITFGFCVYQSVWLEYNTVLQVILWLPCSLFCIEKILELRKFIWSFGLVLSICLSILAGHPQIALYSIIFSYIYALHRIISQKFSIHKIKLLFYISFLFVCGIGLSGMQLIPGLELMKYSARSSHDYNFFVQKLLIQPWQWVMFFVPDFFGNPATRSYWIQDTYVSKVTSVGIIAVPFIFISIKKFADPLVRFFIITPIVLIFLATANPLVNLLYKFPLSFFLTGSPALFMFIFCFCMSVLAAFGLELFINNKTSKMQIILPLGIILFLLWTVILVWKPLFPVSIKPFVQVAFKSLLLQSILCIFAACVIFASKKLRSFAIILLIMLQAGGLFYAFQKFNPFVPKQTIFPEAPVINFLQKNGRVNRYFGFGQANIEANFATQEKLFSPEGYDPLYPAWYGEFIQSSYSGNIATSFTDKTRSDAKLAPSSSEEFALNTYRMKVLNALGVKYILDRVENASTEKTFPPSQFNSVYQVDGWSIYENKQALPRAFLAGSFAVYNSPKEFQQMFFAKNFNPKNTILLQSAISASLRPNAQGSVSIKSYAPNNILLQASATGTQLLFLSDTFYPGWKAFIDGKESAIYRADYAFRAVVVPEGKHTIIFTYIPESFYFGVKLSIISLLACFISMLLFKRVIHEK